MKGNSDSVDLLYKLLRNNINCQCAI